MPSLKKKVLSLYLRTGCLRQLALNLYSDPELRGRGMPPRQTARPGLGLVGQAGYQWQDEKVSDLNFVFGSTNVHVNTQMEGNRPGTLSLKDVLPNVKPYQFVVEGRYEAETQIFKDAVDIGELRDREGEPLSVGKAFPDIIQVLPAMVNRPTWERLAEDSGPAAIAQEVLPSGDMQPLSADDERLRLRVIDIKQSAEPGAHYFAEVVYYSITLASWLVEQAESKHFVVVAAPAVWPGSYEASEIMQARERCRKEGRDPMPEELALALEDDIEIAPFDVFAPRLRRFFHDELPYVLQTPWETLPWHVSYVCKGCEFFGYPWLDKDGNPTNDERHCWPMAAKTDHLSRVAGLSKGSAKLLESVVSNVGTLAGIPITDTIFNASPTLRSKRTVYPHRARALHKGETGIIPDSGSDALMPLWPDLRIYIFLDYDISSAITATFSLRGRWKEPLPWGSTEMPQTKRWAAFDGEKPTHFQEVFLVDQRDLTREREELLKFLRSFRDILDEVRQQDEKDIIVGRRADPNKPEKNKRSTYQIYLWDGAQHKHLVRVVGRHLSAILTDNRLRDLAWLFPPPELLSHPEEASYKSPFTFVSNVIQNTVAVPVPHHYTLLDVVKTYRPEIVQAPRVHPLYWEPLSDLIPSERLHEMWTRRGNWLQTTQTVQETTGKKLAALAYVVGRLENDMKDILLRAPAPPLVRPPSRLIGVPPQSEIWYEYTRLNAALNELDEHIVRAMPPHERVARFKSAHLLRRLEGNEKVEAHKLLEATAQQPLSTADELMIYILSADSCEFNVRPPTLGYALAPRNRTVFLGEAAFPLIKDHGIKVNAKLEGSVAEVGLTKVSIQAIDRLHGLIALKPWQTNCVLDLEQAGIVDFRTDVMLDPVGDDFLSKKVRFTLSGIGWPESVQHNAATLQALGIEVPETKVKSPESPASEFLWQASTLAETDLEIDVVEARTVLETAGIQLNDSQWTAWKAALTRRLALIWGPPGTGKSQTLRAVVAGAVWMAHRDARPLRLLIASNTYAAVDNVLLGADKLLTALGIGKPYQLIRLQGQYNSPPSELADHPGIKQVMVTTTKASAEVIQLQNILNEPKEIIIVAGPSQQLYNLAIATKNKTKKETSDQTQRRWFDFIIIDEASQLDVAESTLIVSKAADRATFVLAGDDKQLPPIHPATPPQGLDHIVGSVYGYIRHHHNVKYHPLQVNYRACHTLVTFTKRAGYDPGLNARHTNLHLALFGNALPTMRPEKWPDILYWTPDWAHLLDPAKPATCFIYQDEIAGQANDFEADAVAALLWLLFGRIDRQLNGELDESGLLKPLTNRPHDAKEFWKSAVGVVTPHRAQMGKLVARLQTIFPEHDPSAIWNAVDTVERFQGQQRDVIIASFGLGDPDLIQAEDEFLYSLNRFNVMASRARAKLIILTTRSLIDHLADDVNILEESRLLKNFAESFCQHPQMITLGYRIDGANILRPGVLRTQ